MNEHRNTQEIVILITAVILIGVLLYTVQTIVTPFVVTGVVLLLLYPFRQSSVAARLMLITGVLFVVWFVY
jgi:energy-coupling factor transporter transmembrane protein EcfT